MTERDENLGRNSQGRKRDRSQWMALRLLPLLVIAASSLFTTGCPAMAGAMPKLTNLVPKTTPRDTNPRRRNTVKRVTPPAPGLGDKLDPNRIAALEASARGDHKALNDYYERMRTSGDAPDWSKMGGDTVPCISIALEYKKAEDCMGPYG